MPLIDSFSPTHFPGAARRLLLCLTFVVSTSLPAQRVLGPSDDATVVPRGMLRVTVSPRWERYHERFADGLGSTRRGTREPLAADFHRDSLGPAAFPALAAVNAGLREIVGGSGPLPLSLGSLQARFDAQVARTPIVVEYGVTRRLTLGGVLPMVSTRAEVSLNPNADGRGTLGLNPSFGFPSARARNALVVAELQAANQRLQQLIQQCAGSSAPECTAINGDRTRAQNLSAAATTAIAGIQNTYGTTATNGSRYSPVGGSALHTQVESRLRSLSDEFALFLGAPSSGASWIVSRPVGAPPLAYDGFQAIVTDSAYGIGADSLISIPLSRPGDLELGVKYLLFDSFGGQAPQRFSPRGLRFRVAVAGVYRFGTGLRDSVMHFADLGTGDGQSDLEGRVFADVMLGRHVWASAVARYAIQQSDDLRLRIPRVAHEPLPPADRISMVRRDLGDALTLELSPRWVLGENLGLAGTWQYWRKGRDRLTPANRALDPTPLVTASEQTAQRALLSLTYSNVAPYLRGQARTPMEVSITVGRTITGAGNVPASTITGLTLRVYNQLFGAGR